MFRGTAEARQRVTADRCKVLVANDALKICRQLCPWDAELNFLFLILFIFSFCKFLIGRFGKDLPLARGYLKGVLRINF